MSLLGFWEAASVERCQKVVRHVPSMPRCLSHLPDVNPVAPGQRRDLLQGLPQEENAGCFPTDKSHLSLSFESVVLKCGSPVLRQYYFPGNMLKVQILGLTWALQETHLCPSSSESTRV